MEHGRIVWYGDVDEGYTRYQQAILAKPVLS